MKWRTTTLKTRLYIVAAVILAVGILSSSLAFYCAGQVDTENVLGDPLNESKSYRRSLELYGGKANLLASDFMQWFNGLWHGKSLAITLGCITVFLCLAILLFASSLPPDSE